MSTTSVVERLPIADITVGHRHRRHLGDIAALAKSIETVGLMHPIVVDEECNLIVGRRALGEHSAKPDIFYDIVRRASYPGYGEAFQRVKRDEFQNLFKVQEAK